MIREQLDEQFQNLTLWLLTGLIDFDFIAESLLPGQCEPASIDGTAFPVGEMRYNTVIVPGCETLRSTTLEQLEAFRNAGGCVIFMGTAPLYQDAVLNDRGRKLYDRCERIGFGASLLDALADLRELDIRDNSGGRTTDLFCQLREEEDGRWLFIAHSKDPANKDIVTGNLLHIKVRGEWACTLYDTMNGNILPLECGSENGWTEISYPFYDHDSLLLRFTREPMGTLQKPPPLSPVTNLIEPGKTMAFDPHSAVRRWLGRVPVTLEEPNVLLLDLAEYSLNGEAYRPLEEILRLDNILRHELGWPVRMEAVAQPWVEDDETMTHTVDLRFTFNSRLALNGAKLALERPDLVAIRLNSVDVPVKPDGWYVDKCIRTVPLPVIVEGKNTLEVTYRYGRKVDLESLYIIGDFGVEVAGCNITLTDPVRKLAFGDITWQGLPFYGGNIVYHLETETLVDHMEVAASCYRGQLIGVLINGEDKGCIIYSPYRLTVRSLVPGRQKVDLRFFGNRVNTFGQLHCNNRDDGLWWGPNSWRTAGEEWTYEYRFWKQGILKSPEIT